MGNLIFMRWFIGWYKEINNEMNIQIVLPNILAPFKEDNVVIIDVFEKKDNGIDAKKYLNVICQKANELNVVIYLEPKPRTHRLDENKKEIITRDWLINYYSKFGFELTPNKQFMKRIPSNYTIGGL